MSLIDKVVQVIFRGKDEVSPVASKASESATGFAARAAAAYAIIAKGISMVADKIGASLKAFDDMNASQRKLEGTAKLLGVSQQYLNDIVAVGQQKFSLSRSVANDYAVEMAKLAINSGQAGDATKLLASFLDLGAARGLNAAQSLQAAAQSIIGIDEGTDKLFGKNPSGLFADFAEVIGRSAGKFSDQDKAAALAYATLESGLKVAGSYEAFLQSASGKQEVLNQRMMEAEASFGSALQPIRLLTMELVESLMPALGPLARILGGALAAAVVTVAKVFNIAYGSVGLLVEGLGKLTRNKAMEQWGRSAAESANTLGAKLNEAGEAAGRAIRGVDNAAKQSAAEYKVVETKRGETVLAMAKLVEDAKKREGTAHNKATDEAAAAATRLNTELINRLGKPLEVAIGLTEGAITRLGTAARQQLPVEQSQQFLTHMQGLVAASHQARDRMLGVAEGTTTAANKSKDLSREVEQFARGALDAADAFGVIDDKAKDSLNSAINIASAVSSMAKSGLSFAGVTGVIGGVASLVSSMMQGDSERRRLLRDNNTALARLSTDISGLNLNVTGEDLSKAQNALGDLSFSTKFADFIPNMNKLRTALESQGLSMKDLERISGELGINLKDKDGNFSFAAVNQLIQGLKTVQPGRVGQGFQDQLGFFKESQRIDGATGTGAIQGLLDFLRNVGGVTALDGLDANDPNALRTALRGIFTQLNNGEGVQGLGKLTGSQFMQILLGLIGDIDALGPSAPGAGGSGGTGSGTGSAGGTSGGSGGTGSGGSGSSGGASGTGTGGVPPLGPTGGEAETVQAVLRAQTVLVTDILTAHTTLHTRVAAATEGTFETLVRIEKRLASMSERGNLDALDRGLEADRYALAVQQGVGASF